MSLGVFWRVKLVARHIAWLLAALLQVPGWFAIPNDVKSEAGGCKACLTPDGREGSTSHLCLLCESVSMDGMAFTAHALR